jgi:hypothetical protein
MVERLPSKRLPQFTAACGIDRLDSCVGVLALAAFKH